MTVVPAAAAGILLAAALAGCGEDPRPAAPPPATALTVEVRRSEAAGPRRTRIDCGSDTPSDTCRRLAELAPAAFDPQGPGTACTQIYGGPATAELHGRLGGEPVDASFALRNGCEIARWQRFSWLLGEPPALQRPSP